MFAVCNIGCNQPLGSKNGPIGCDRLDEASNPVHVKAYFYPNAGVALGFQNLSPVLIFYSYY